MADQPTTSLPPDAAAASIGRNSIAGGKGMFSSTPDKPVRPATPAEISEANRNAGERGKSIAERSAAYMASYDRAEKPNEAKPTSGQNGRDTEGTEKPSDGSAAGDGQQPTNNEDLERRVAEFRKMEADRKLWDETFTSPSVYKDELSDSYKAVDGIQFKFAEGDPLLEQAKILAHKHRLTQAQYSDMLSLYAGKITQDAVNYRDARQAEIEKLGATGPARIDAVQNGFTALVGEEGTKHLMSMMVTAPIVGVLEKILTKFANQGVGQFNSSGREPQQRGIPDEVWSGMNYNERRNYQIEHAAAQQPQRRR